MDATWAGIIIGAVSALAGVAVSAVAEHFRSRESFKREKAWSVSEEKRARLEKLWETLDEIRLHYVGRYYRTLEAIELQTPLKADDARAPITRFRMLTQLYLPHLGEKAKLVERSASALGDECARANSIVQSSITRLVTLKADDKSEARRPVFLAGSKFDAAVDDMQNAMYDYSVELTAERSKAMA